MPELPEVEVVRRGLHEHVVGRTISRATVQHPRAVRRHVGEDFAVALAGATITDTRRRGKYAWLALDDEDALLLHLGMSGQMLIKPTDAVADKHQRVLIEFADERNVLSFVDQRTFGHLLLDRGGAQLPSQIAHIARDPLDSEFDQPSVVDAIRHKDTVIKRALLDQSVVSGIGNIYADEALWRAELHGERPTRRLTRAEVGRCIDAAREVMVSALDQGGTSFDALYVNVNGASGYFTRFLHSYGREGEPCERCGALIVREPFMNRSSYFCPRCQRRPRAKRSS